MLKQTVHAHAFHCTFTLYIEIYGPDLSKLDGSIGRGPLRIKNDDLKGCCSSGQKYWS